MTELERLRITVENQYKQIQDLLRSERIDRNEIDSLKTKVNEISRELVACEIRERRLQMYKELYMELTDYVKDVECDVQQELIKRVGVRFHD